MNQWEFIHFLVCVYTFLLLSKCCCFRPYTLGTPFSGLQAASCDTLLEGFCSGIPATPSAHRWGRLKCSRAWSSLLLMIDGNLVGKSPSFFHTYDERTLRSVLHRICLNSPLWQWVDYAPFGFLPFSISHLYLPINFSSSN